MTYLCLNCKREFEAKEFLKVVNDGKLSNYEERSYTADQPICDTCLEDSKE